MNTRITYILFLFILLEGCSSSMESTVESINNVKSSRYHNIPHLDSYIIVPNNFELQDSSIAVNKATNGFIRWQSRSSSYDEWVHDLDSVYRAKLEEHKRSEPGLIEKYEFVDLLINGVRAAMLSCECYYENSPEQQITHRLIIDRNGHADEFIGNGDLRYKAEIEDSILFSLRSIIP